MAKKKKRTTFKWLKVILFASILSVVSYYGYRSVLSTVDVNLVAEKSEVTSPGGRAEVKLDQNGCYYKQVQCAKAPCEPVLVCPPENMPKPSPSGSCIPQPTCPPGRMCAAVMLPGYCGAKPTPVPTPPAGCTSWFDGCNTCTVQDGKIGACTKMKCMGETKPPHCLSYSGPITTSVPKPSLTPTPYPTATPSPLSIFKVSEACGPTSFRSITFTCNNQGSSTLADNVCTDFYLAYEKALLACSGPRSQ